MQSQAKTGTQNQSLFAEANFVHGFMNNVLKMGVLFLFLYPLLMGCTPSSDDATESETQGPIKITITATAGGGYHVVALLGGDLAGRVVSWGEGSSGQLGNGEMNPAVLPVFVKDPNDSSGYLSNIVALSAGYEHTIALKKDGTVWAWGDNSNGQLGVNDASVDNSSTPMQVVDGTGDQHLSSVASIAANDDQSFALKTDGTVWSWGRNTYGELGDGTYSNRSIPVIVCMTGDDPCTTPLTDVIQISAGFWHTMALKNDGSVWTWGYGGEGELGDGTSTSSSTPVQVVGEGGSGLLQNIDLIAAGGYEFSVAVDQSNDRVWSWGYGWDGELGVGFTTTSSTPMRVCESYSTVCDVHLSGVKKIDAGPLHVVFTKTDDSAWSWGSNYQAQTGHGYDGWGSEWARPTAGEVCDVTGNAPCSSANENTLTDVIAVAGGGCNGCDFSLAVKSDGTLLSWGDRSYGQIGDGKTGLFTLPNLVHGLNDEGHLTGVTEIDGGGAHSLALMSDNTVVAWGRNTYGQLGNGNNTDTTAPVLVTGISTAAAIGAGNTHSVALLNDGSVKAWGKNNLGQLGDGTITSPRTTPVTVGGVSGITSIAVGGDTHSNLALDNSGDVWAWGYNSWGQLGDGTTTNRTSAVQVCGIGDTGCSTHLSGVTALSTGISHALALLEDGTVVAWGRQQYGMLGNGYTIDTNVLAPTPVCDAGATPPCSAANNNILTNVASIAASSNNSYVVKNDGSVWAWGNSSNGSLAGSSATLTATPIQICDVGKTAPCSSYLSGVVDLVAEANHVLTLKSDGPMVSWGYNVYGAIGIGSMTNYAVPTVVIGESGSGILSGVGGIGLGYEHSLAFSQDNAKVWAWGRNQYGPLGVGSTDRGTQQIVPTPVVFSHLESQ